MNKKIFKDTIAASTFGICEVTGFLGVLLLIIMPILVIVGIIKKIFNKSKI